MDLQLQLMVDGWRDKMGTFFKSDAYSVKTFERISKTELKDNFVFALFQEDTINAAYTYYDRVIIIGAIPVKKTLSPNIFAPELHAEFLLENRELGILNIGGDGIVVLDKQTFKIQKNECLYVSLGTKDIQLKSQDAKKPATFYLVSTPAHSHYPTKLVTLNDANKIELGNPETLNVRTIYQLIHPKVLKTCQLSMGITILKPGSVWNTFPPHTHERRMEAYLYYDLSADNLIYHFMGQPVDNKVVILHNQEVVINPPWSVHYGVGSINYTFCWAMAGENKDFDDMDQIKTKDLC